MKNIKLLLAATVAGFLFSGTASSAEEIVCTGKNLMPQIEKLAPKIAENLLKEAAAVPYGKGLTWKIEKDGIEPSYLFGTIHLSDPRLVKLKPAAEKAYQASTTLALEITEILEPNKLAAAAAGMMQYTMYLDGSSLETRLDQAQSKAVSALAESKLGLPWSVANRMKPWALMGSLALPACEMARKRAGKPILDMNLGLQAKAQGKTIVPLETMESQIKAMASLPESFALKGLLQSVSLGDRMDDLFETMIDLYTKEETAMIWSLMRRVGEEGFVPAQENADYAAFQRVIVDKRNQTMAEVATQYIDKGGVFIAVGALHLPGKAGMVNILAQKGYRVSRISE